MQKRITPRLATSEYVNSDQTSEAVWRARLKLMQIIVQAYPVMLKRLSEDVFPAYADLEETGFDFDVLWHPRLSAHTMIPDGPLKSALLSWAETFHARTAWFMDETLKTLDVWRVSPDARQDRMWHSFSLVGSTLAMGERFQFDFQGWEMQVLTWSAYKRSLEKEFQGRLTEYERASRELAESRGLVRAPRKYSPANLEWFALHQFAGLSSGQIARRSKSADSVDESTVLKGVKAAAELIAWGELRAAPNRKIS